MQTVYIDHDNTVREILPPEASPITDFYSADFCTRCVEAPDEVEQHWVYDPDTGTFSPPQPPEPVTPDYAILVQQYIHEEYSLDDEIAMLYKSDSDPDFIAYRAYVEECKARAKAETEYNNTLEA